MNDLMREQFEDWSGNKSDKEIHQRGPRIGKYKNPVMQRSWESWQASRECLVIELPKPYVWDNDGGFERESDPDSECSMALIPKIDVMQSIHAAGVKTK